MKKIATALLVTVFAAGAFAQASAPMASPATPMKGTSATASGDTAAKATPVKHKKAKKSAKAASAAM